MLLSAFSRPPISVRVCVCVINISVNGTNVEFGEIHGLDGVSWNLYDDFIMTLCCVCAIHWPETSVTHRSKDHPDNTWCIQCNRQIAQWPKANGGSKDLYSFT